MKHKKPYFDYAATTPADPRVIAAMAAYWGHGGEFGNPSSLHQSGVAASQAAELARKQVARQINANPGSVVWTSGATEANNLALQGFVRHPKNKCNKIITLATEHSAVLDTVRALRTQGCETVILPVKSDGLVDIAVIDKELKKGRTLLSVMWVNNETGVIQPIEQIAKLCKRYKTVFHVDAAQALGKVAIDMKKISVDLLSISGHKVYGPKGIGALYVRPRTAIAPLLHGGGQERGLRPGTLPVPLIIGMGAACSILTKEWKNENAKIEKLHDRILSSLKKDTKIKVNGGIGNKVPHILNVRFDGTRGELLPHMANVDLSSGAACSAAKIGISHVLRAMRLKRQAAQSSIRISLGRFTSKADVDNLLHRARSAVAKISV